MESALPVYTSVPSLPFTVSFLWVIVRCVPARLKLPVRTKGELFQNQIIPQAIWFLSRAVLRAHFDVDWGSDEHNGKVCAALLSLWHCVFKSFWCFFFAILLWHSGSPQDISELAKHTVGLWEPGIWSLVGLSRSFETLRWQFLNLKLHFSKMNNSPLNGQWMSNSQILSGPSISEWRKKKFKVQHCNHTVRLICG